MKIPREFKYIVIDETFPVLFTPAQSHDAFKSFGNITSAGFATIYVDPDKRISVNCHGSSYSLKLKSKESEDAALIGHMFVETF